MQIAPTDLVPRVAAVFARMGARDEVARVVAAHLVDNEIVGRASHGLTRVAWYAQQIEAGLIDPAAEVAIEAPTPATLAVDGNWAFGPWVAARAIERSIEVVRDVGTCTTIVCRSAHVGRVAAYTEMAARQQLVALAMLSYHGGAQYLCGAPFGGTAARFAANTIAFSAPSADGPVVQVDVTLTAASHGTLRGMRDRGEQLAEPLLFDGDGARTADPQRYFETGGAIEHFGGSLAYKSYGLALMVEILCGAMSIAGCSRPDCTPGNSLYLQVIDPARFTTLAAFSARIADFIAFVKSSPVEPGHEIHIPGERHDAMRAEAGRSGVSIDDATWCAFLAVEARR